MKVTFISSSRRRVFGLAAAVSVATLSAASIETTAEATPRTLPFTYPNETLQKGQFEGELYTDVNPLRVPAEPAGTGVVWSPEYVVTSELEYGVTDHVELGFYQVLKGEPQPGGGNSLEFDGLKWRVRGRFAEPGVWPIDVGLYFELETMHDEIAFEGKVNLQKVFGPVRWMTNLWVEEAIEHPFDSKAHGRAAHFIINPTMGFSFQVTPAFQPGIEGWVRGEIPASGDTAEDRRNNGLHGFLGPSFHVNFGRFWWSAAVYKHLNTLHLPAAGEPYGPLWFRSVLGLEI